MRIFRYLIIFFLSAVLAGSFYQKNAEEADRETIPGQWYEVNGSSYHMLCRGSGAQTIIFESGRWGWYADWTPLWDLLPSTLRKCTYDRLGMGWSSSRTGTPQSGDVARQLHRLLENTGIDGDIILVAHSLGGIYARKFVALFPERVSALVLIDSTHEQAPQRLSYPAEDFTMVQLCRAVAWTGVLRAFGAMDMVVPKGASPQRSTELLTVANRSQFCSGLLDAATGIAQELQTVDDPKSLGDLPLIVVRRGKTAEGYDGLEGEQKDS
jgi:pimeloyl-ACP methyl ester carboxylesterase